MKIINENQLIGLLERGKVSSVGDIIPVNDLIKHIPASNCQCEPTLRYDAKTEGVEVRHKAIDGRTAVEQANDIIGNKGVSAGGWEVIVTLIPKLCTCPACSAEREDGPDVVMIHEAYNDLLKICESIIPQEELIQFIEAQEHLNVFTGLDNIPNDPH